jgi:hypothetical protein
MPVVLKSGSLSLLEPSDPVQAFNGIALPLPLPLLGVLDTQGYKHTLTIAFSLPQWFH